MNPFAVGMLSAALVVGVILLIVAFTCPSAAFMYIDTKSRAGPRTFVDDEDVPEWFSVDPNVDLSGVSDFLKTQTLAVLIVTKDNQNCLQRTIDRVEWLMDQFSDARTYVYEDSSSDNTPALLNSWSDTSSRVSVLCDTPNNNGANRITKIARARQKCYNMYVGNAEGFRADYVIVMDADLIHGFSQNGFLSCFAEDCRDRWDIVAASGYDVEHYRKPLAWLKNYTKYGSKGYFYGMYDTFAYVDTDGNCARYKGNIRHKKGDDVLVSVRSAFGGMAIYRGSFYNNDVEYGESGTVCEHAVVHEQLVEKGARMFIHKNFIVIR